MRVAREMNRCIEIQNRYTDEREVNRYLDNVFDHERLFLFFWNERDGEKLDTFGRICKYVDLKGQIDSSIYNRTNEQMSDR